jgi:hypothetical protein
MERSGWASMGTEDTAQCPFRDPDRACHVGDRDVVTVSTGVVGGRGDHRIGRGWQVQWPLVLQRFPYHIPECLKERVCFQGQLPHPRRDRSRPDRTRPHHLARTPRPHPATPGHPDGATRIRTDRHHSPRRPPRPRPARLLSRQRPQRPSHPADPPHRQRPTRLADRTRRPPRPTTVSHPQRPPTQPDAVERLVTKHATTAATTRTSIQAKNITPHTLRHSAVICSAVVG